MTLYVPTGVESSVKTLSLVVPIRLADKSKSSGTTSAVAPLGETVAWQSSSAVKPLMLLRVTLDLPSVSCTRVRLDGERVIVKSLPCC